MKKFQHKLLSASYPVFLAMVTTVSAMPLDWTNTDGKTINAEFVRLEGESVIVRKDEKSFTVPFAKLTPASVAQAKKLGGIAEAPVALDTVAISPESFAGKTLEECEKILGKPTADLKQQFAKEFKPNVPGITRIRLKRYNRATECLDAFYFFPKGTIKTIGDAFSKIGLKPDGVSIGSSYLSGGLSNEDKEIMENKSRALGKVTLTSELRGLELDSELRIAIRNITGGLEATWIPAESKMRPQEDPHPDEDVLFVNESYEQSAKRRLNNLKLAESKELRNNGTFGFPQKSSVVLSDQLDARFSVWSNPEWLYVQVLIWVDGDDSVAKTPEGKENCDQTWLFLDLGSDQTRESEQDLNYVLDPEPAKRGLFRRKKMGDRQYEMVAESKGRGSIRFVDADNGKKVRVDSFLIPLAEIGRTPASKIRLAVSGNSPQPEIAFNSAELKTNGKAMFYISMPKMHDRDFTLGLQTGIIEPDKVPDGVASRP